MPRCARCKKPIDNEPYTRVAGKSYHRRHFLCAACGTPIAGGSYAKDGGRYYDPDCYRQRVAVRCTLCGEIIQGRFLKDYWGNIYHEGHKDRASRCDYCSRFISEKTTGGGTRYRDGRHICGLCRPAAVQDTKEARELLGDARKRLERYGIAIDRFDPGFHLIDRGKLKRVSRLSRPPDSEETGFTHFRSRSLGGRIVSFELNIYILLGLPRGHFIEAAAHELMHVWQYLNAPPKNDRALCEGSCNYAAYLVLQELSGAESKYLVHNLFGSKDRFYGEGFRRVARLVEKRGTKYWLSRLRANRRFPRG